MFGAPRGVGSIASSCGAYKARSLLPLRPQRSAQEFIASGRTRPRRVRAICLWEFASLFGTISYLPIFVQGRTRRTKALSAAEQWRWKMMNTMKFLTIRCDQTIAIQ